MTRLEKEIKEAIDFRTNMSPYNDPEPDDRVIKAAAEVARKYIINALEDGHMVKMNDYDFNWDRFKAEWLNENGITE